MKTVRSAVAVTLVGALFAMFATFWAPASAGQETATASGFGARIHVALLGTDAVNLPPTPYASVPNATGSNSDSRTIVGPIRLPQDSGQVVSDLRALHASATRSTGPADATGVGQIAHAALFESGGTPAISVDALHAVAHARCLGPNNATVDADGSRLASVTLGGQTIDATPAPNTRIPLVVTSDPNPDKHFGVLVILNEQVKASDGAGIRVTMVHIIVYSPKTPNLVIGDIQLGSAEASVYCGPGEKPSDSGATVHTDKVAHNKTNDLGVDVTSGGARAHRGDVIEWTITVRNNGTVGCDLFVVTDTLPAHFTYMSAAGDFTNGATPTQDGSTIKWSSPGRYALPVGGILTEKVTASVDKDAPLGTYTNLFDIQESSCSSFTQGLRGPVEVVSGAEAVSPPPPSNPSKVLGLKLNRTLPATGTPVGLIALAGLLMVAAGGVMLKSTRDVHI